ncbi:MAG: GNAT family N-acetyltransferase [Burkholderiales bacterium]|nr:GNAT family N-acetyltransferase [Burkholderiales bacterium]
MDSPGSSFILRHFDESDTLAVRAILADAAVAVPFFGRVLPGDQLERRIARHWGGGPGAPERRIVACVVADGRLVGAGLRRGAEIGWFVAPDWWRRGVATALVRRLCMDPETAFAQVHRDNLASIRLLEKLGFRFAGLRPPPRASFEARARLRYAVPAASRRT